MLDASISIDGVVSKDADQTKERTRHQLLMIKNAGINYIDCGIEYNSIAYTDKCDRWIKEFAEVCNEEEITVFQTHMPTYRGIGSENGVLKWNISEWDEKYTDVAMRSTAEWGCKNIVVHPFSPKPDWKKEYYQSCVNMNVEYFKKLLEQAYKYDVNICIETMSYFGADYAYCAEPSELLELKEKINDDKIKFCFDTGHVFFAGKDVAKAIESLGKDISVLHLQDNSGFNDDHNVLPFGKIDWHGVAAALRNINYTGTLNFEVQGGRLKSLDEQAQIAYLRFTKEMAEYLKRIITNN